MGNFLAPVIDLNKIRMGGSPGCPLPDSPTRPKPGDELTKKQPKMTLVPDQQVIKAFPT